MRAPILALLAGSLSLVACDDSQPKDLIERDTGTSTDAAVGTNDSGADPDAAAMDAGLTPDMGEDPDMGQADMGIPDDVYPRHNQVATATVNQQTYVGWIDNDGGFMLRVFGPDGEAESTVSIVEDAGEDARVVGLEVSGTPWFVFGEEGEPLRAIQADFPEDVYALGLYGPPLIAHAGTDVIIMGVDESGANAFHLLNGDDTPDDVRPPEIDTAGLPFPDHMIGINSAVVLRFGSAGQCGFLDPTGGALGNFPCFTGQGRMIGDGRQALATINDVDGDISRVLVRTVFGSGPEPYGAVSRMVPHDRFQNDGLDRPIVGGRGAVDENGQRPATLAILRFGEMWVSEPMAEWDHPGVRGIVSKAIEAGREAWLLDFEADDGPQVERMALTQQPFANDHTYGIEIDPQCAPTYERCDGVNQDCDDTVDNGLCCDQEDRGVDAALSDLGGTPSQLLVADVNNADAHRVALRVAEDRWVLVGARQGQRSEIRPLSECNPVNRTGCHGSFECTPERVCRRTEPVEGLEQFYRQPVIEGAHHGYNVVAAGGYTALVADNVQGVPTVFWFHNSSGLFTDEEILAADGGLDHARLPVKEAHPLPCDNVFGIDVISHDTVDASLIVVCPDRIVRVFPHEGVADEAFEFDHPAAEWGTLTRIPSSAGDPKQLYVMLRHPTEDGAMALRAYTYRADRTLDPAHHPVPDELVAQDERELIHPVWLHPNFWRDPVQIDDTFRARVLVDSVWQDILTATTPSRTEYARLAHKVISSAAFEVMNDEGAMEWETRWWLVDVEGKNNSYNLWSTRPAFSVKGQPMWTITQGEYDDNIIMLLPPEADGEPWRLRTRVVTCTDL